MKKLIFLILFLLPFICSAQTVEGFSIQHNFAKPNNETQKGLYCTVQLKSITKITADSGCIVTVNKFYENQDIADVMPDSNLVIGKDIVLNYMLYSLPSSETTYFYGKHIGMKSPIEAVIEEIIVFNYSIPAGIKEKEILKNK